MSRLLSLCLLSGCTNPAAPADRIPIHGEPALPVELPPSVEDDTGTPPCTVSVASSFPIDGAVDAYYRAPIHVWLSAPDETATITVHDARGEPVAGDSVVVGDEVLWTGDPRVPLAAHTVQVTHACGTETLDFTTSEVGLPMEVPLVDRVWAIDVAPGLWTAPDGVGPVFAAVFAPYRLLVGVTDTSDPATLSLVLALAENGEQYPCAPSIALDGAAWSDPYFEVAIPRVRLETGVFGLLVDDFTLTGAFSPDGSRLEGGVLAGMLDTRDLGAAFGLGDDIYALCRMAATLDVACTACADGELVCLDVRVEGITGAPAARPVQVITADDVSENPECLSEP